MWSAITERIHFALLHTLHKRSLKSIERYQLRAINRLVPYVRANVPLYADLFARVPVRSFATLHEIAQLPISHKHMYTSRPVEEALDTSRFIPSVWHTTSGTNGEPFSVHRGGYPTHPFYEEFYTLRFLHWKGLPIHRYPNVRIAHVQIHETKRHASLCVPVRAYLSDPEDVLSRIKTFKPEVLTSYASILLDIAEHESSKPVDARLRVSYVASFGEMLTKDARARIEDVLDCEVYSQYGLEEIGAVGGECHLHDGYHINPETVYAEIVREDGTPAPDGERGTVILTNVLNNRMPFIRYDSGDSGVMTREPCACGLRTPRIWIEGRYAAYLTFAGKRIHHLEFDEALDTYMHAIRKYQVVKAGETALVVRIVAGTHYSDAVEERVRAAMRALTGEQVHVQVLRVVSIAPTPRGKSRIILDESIT